MTKLYLECIDATDTKNLKLWGVYLCEPTSIYGSPAYQVWDKTNNYMGRFGADRFAQIKSKKPIKQLTLPV